MDGACLPISQFTREHQRRSIDRTLRKFNVSHNTWKGVEFAPSMRTIKQRTKGLQLCARSIRTGVDLTARS